MIKKIALGILMATATAAMATTYNGNGDTGFGGTVGNGSLTLTDNGTTVSGSFTQGAGSSFNDVLVLYIDSVAGGFTDTSTFTDAGDGLRKAISGFDGGTNRSTLTMPPAFTADYAIALGPVSDTFGGLWQLVGSGSHNFVSSVNLSPLSNATAGTYTFSFDLSQIGLTPNSGASFGLLGTYISNSGFRSTEFIAGNGTGTQGWNPFTGTANGTYTTAAIPEPATVLLVGPALLGGMFFVRRRRA